MRTIFLYEVESVERAKQKHRVLLMDEIIMVLKICISEFVGEAALN